MLAIKPVRKTTRQPAVTRPTAQPEPGVWEVPSPRSLTDFCLHSLEERQRLVNEFLRLAALVMPDLSCVELRDKWGESCRWKQVQDQ